MSISNNAAFACGRVAYIPDLTQVGKHDKHSEEDFAVQQEMLPHWSDLEKPKQMTNPYRKGRHAIKKIPKLKPAVVTCEKPLTKCELHQKSQEKQKMKETKESHKKLLKWKKMGKQPDIRMMVGVHLK